MDIAVRPLYETRFCSLLDEGGELAFPCDAQGKVNLDGLLYKGKARAK